MSFKFENLHIWQKAMTLGEDINITVNNFPKQEMYNLTSQTRRAADLVALNISEGCILQSAAEYRKFLGYSIRSLVEVVTCLYKARYRSYISEVNFKNKYDECYPLMNMIAFRKTIKS